MTQPDAELVRYEGESLAPLSQVPAAARHPAKLYLASLSERSRRAMKWSLDVAAGFLSGGRADAFRFPWWELRYEHVQALRNALAEEYSPSTTNRTLTAIRQVAEAAFGLELIGPDRLERLRQVENVSAERLPQGRELSVAELMKVKDVCEDSGPIGKRDRATLALLARGGLRRQEAVALDVQDYRRLEDAEHAAAEFRVQSGKGRNDRLVPLGASAAEAVEDWLNVRGEEPGPLLTPVRKGGTVEARRLTPQAVYARLKRLADEAGVEEFSPHDLRRTLIGHALDAGADLSTVQKLAGHADPATTARYDKRGERAKREAVARLAF